MSKKNYVSESQLSAMCALIEGGKSQIKMGDWRQAIKILKKVDLKATLEGKRSPLTMLRKSVLADAKAKVGVKALAKSMRKARR